MKFRSTQLKWTFALIGISTHCLAGGQGFSLHVVSSRPETVSSGDALVELVAPLHARWTAELDGRDVTTSLRLSTNLSAHVALIDGLRPGRNTLRIRSGRKIEATLDLLDHPRSGPIFSGPHQLPFVCQTLENGLGPPLDANCSAATVVRYYYKSTEPSKAPAGAPPGDAPTFSAGFKPYEIDGPVPTDVAHVVTSEGHTVPYIVRRELGTINRAVYDIQFLHQPGQPLPSPWESVPSWNGRLVYNFGGGCAAGYRQGKWLGKVGEAQEAALGAGYAIATSTLNIFANHCNDTVAAETLSMVKEHFIERYGKPLRTIGQGGSGGAMQVQLIAQNYPGLVDGIIVNGSFSDVLTYIPPVTDCMLLRNAFQTSPLHWKEEQKTAVTGFATWRTCVKWPILDPRNCDSSIAPELVYDPVSRPHGVRCDIYTNNVNILGRDPKTGLVRRPLDNVGVQYGLLAFNGGQIDAEQFIDLNKRIGGFDEDGNIVRSRTAADLEAVRIAYERGLVLRGGGDLGKVPIVDMHSYTDDQGDNHVYLRAFQTRARLQSANGTTANHAILVGPPLLTARLSDPEDPNSLEIAHRARQMIEQIDAWLQNIAKDTAAGSPAQRLERNRPTDLADGCMQVDGRRIAERATYERPNACNELYPPHKDPRLAAGSPLSGDILKCALKPVSPADYTQPLSDDQLRRLRAIFPNGVCDYSKPGVGQLAPHAVWRTYDPIQ